ncbi:carbohydrate kinase family protein [Desertivirga arenae]|uniref:carbohydrate kinase family protein n=1 Tax=Desertivirga arenae TaxID=2810309 RepID=UPI001A97C068|nr:carbohydrate kinase [Pedobacter sp. SYSU D00823]
MKKVVCFGEVLWDNFKDGRKPGGAPMNAALHLFRNAVNAVVISSLGEDQNGEDLRTFLETQGLGTDHIQQHPTLPTGVVEVNLDEQQQATYTIVKPVAWDDIKFSMALSEVIENADALLFGSLASRDERSRTTLFQLIPVAKLKVLDLNLRPPHVDHRLIKELILKADLLKLNEDELAFLGDLFNVKGDHIEGLISAVAEATGIKTVCVTLGAEGAAVYHDGNFYKHKGFKVTVVDTVGAGDAFLATFLAGYLEKRPIEAVLERACAAGALVASREGANPDYSLEDVSKFLH